MVRIRVSSPFARDLIRSVLLLGKFKEDYEGFEADEDIISQVLSKASTLVDKNMKIPLTGNDKKPFMKILGNCMNFSELPLLSDFVSNASRFVKNLAECEEEEAKKLQILKAEYYENTKTPLMSYEHEVLGDGLTVALAFAGYGVWNLGRIRYSEDRYSLKRKKSEGRKQGSRKYSEDRYSLLALPMYLDEDAFNILTEVKMRIRLPRLYTYDWALQIWLALNLQLNSTIKVVLSNVGKKVYVKPTITVDLKTEREGLKRVFSTFNEDLGKLIEELVLNVMSENADNNVLRFVKLLYEVSHGTLNVEDLKLFGMREYILTLGGNPNRGDLTKKTKVRLYESMMRVASKVLL